MAALVCSVKGNTAFQEAIGARGVVLSRQIGIATYPLYLLHDKIGQVIMGGLHRRLGYTGALVSAVSFAVVSALVVSELLEPQVRSTVDGILHFTRTRVKTAML